MYKIYYDIDFENGSKITLEMSCTNKRKMYEEHKDNSWNKLDYGIYKCPYCGCRMTMKAEFKEEEVK